MVSSVYRLLFAVMLALNLLCHAHAEDYTVRVGAVLPLSGQLAYVGQDIRRGVELALEERSGGSPRIEFFWEDGKFAPKESVVAARKLIDVDKVDFIISLWDTADVIAPVTEQARVIQLSIRWNPDVAARHRYTFTFESTYPTYYRDIVKLIKKEGLRTAVLLHEETQAGTNERKSFESSAKELGLEILAVNSFPTGETDFRAVITNLVSKNPDIFVNEGFPPASEILVKQLRALRPNMRHVGFYEVFSDKSLIEGQPFVSQVGFLPEFSKKFEKRYGEPFKIRAPYGYEVVRLIAWAYSQLKSDKKPEIAAVRDKLETLKDFDSVLGKLSINQTRNIEHPNTLKVVRNGIVERY